MPGPVRVADAGELGVAGQQAVDQRAACVAGARVDDQAGRLVDHDHVVVGVDDGTSTVGLGLDGRPSAARLGVDVDHRRPRPSRSRAAWCTTAPSTRTAPAATSAAASARLTPVTWRPRGRAARRRAARGPPRWRTRSRSASSAAVALEADERPAGCAPTTTPMSATLNTGHHWRSMKSTTAPLRNPSSPRKARSARLPSAPPRTRPDGHRAEPGAAVRPASEQDARPRTMASSGDQRAEPAPLPMLNAAPVLKARLKPQRSDDVDRCAVGERVRRAHHLVSWSSDERPMAADGGDRCAERRRRRPLGGRRRRPRTASAQRRPKPADLVLDPLAGPRDGLEPLLGDRLARTPRRCRRCRTSNLASAWSISSTAGRAWADRARSRSRSTLRVSPSPDSSSNCTSPGSKSATSESASA